MTSTLTTDVLAAEVGKRVELVGFVSNRRDYSSYTYLQLQDVAGVVDVRIEIPGGLERQATLEGVRKKTRLRIGGLVRQNDTGKKYLFCQSPPEVLGRTDTGLAELDEGLKEHASRMLLTRVRRIVDKLLLEAEFIEFEPRLISTSWGNSGLEPLRVIYPGFGGEATLATSPASQILDFIMTTGSPRAYATSRCFATTFRYDNAGTESLVTCARAIDLEIEKERELIWGIARGILSRLRGINSLPGTVTVIPMDWPPGQIDIEPAADYQLRCLMAPDELAQDPVPRGIQIVYRLYAPNDVLLIEGARESFQRGRSLSTIVVHLEQFLQLLETMPMRQLRDLGRFGAWSRR